MLEAYQSPNLDKTPSTYLDPTGTWNPIYVGCIAFACNSDWFKEKGLEYPTSWEDLLKPEFKGEIIMAHPATSGTAYTVLATLVQLKGDDQVWDYLEKLMTTYPSVPAEDWKKYLCIVQKAVFSEEEISQEEARFCYRLYRKYRNRRILEK